MANTIISDIIIPAKWNQYVINRTAELSAFSQSGIVSNSGELDALAAGGGKTINMPHFNDLTGADEVDSDVTASVPEKITTGQDVAVLHVRRKSWSVNDLSHVMAGADPFAAIGDLAAGYWARRRQAIVFSTLKGVFASASMSANVSDISAGTGAAAVLSGETFIDAVTNTLGDHADDITAIGMHSLAFAKLQKDNLIAFIPDSEGKVNIPTYLGRRVIVDDGCPVATGVYTSYLFGSGALGLGNGMAKHPVETDRDALAGDDILVNRQAFILHPRGVKFNSASVAGAAPTNAELETASNWTKVYDTKKIKIVKFVYKLA